MSEPRRGTDRAGDFAEIWESERRNASYLRVVTGGLLVLLLALSTGWCRSASRTLQPVFVRVDEIGHAEALDYAALTWQNDPLHPSTKYFLRQFVTDHYSRRFATVGECAVENLVLRILARPEEPHEATRRLRRCAPAETRGRSPASAGRRTCSSSSATSTPTS